MIKSIRWRFFIGISALIVFFVLFSWILNTMYLGKYYTFEKKSALVENYKMINEIYKGEPYDISLDLEKIGQSAGINVIILGSDFQPKYGSVPRSFNREEHRHMFEPLGELFKSREGDLSEKGYIIETTGDSRLNINFLNLLAKLDNGDFLLLNTPLISIQKNVHITNKFFIFTGLLTILIGTIAVYFFTGRVTKPILELKNIAQQMSKLDFRQKYAIKTKDEIGQLGESINSLSEQLDKSISELREANLKLEEDIKRERKIDEMRKEFVSNVSHELKTPIALIQGYSEGLKVNVMESEEDKNFYCDVIVDEAKKMDKLVKELLDLSLIESGYFKLEREAFDISQLIDMIVDKYRLIFTDKNVKLIVSKDENIFVDGDAVRIEQVLQNYINNAINHVDENKILKLSLKSESNKVKVSVYNSGKAIPEESIDKIWTSFYKADKARTRAYGGTGLGLSIVRAIMELHTNNYGAVNVDHGVEFWFELNRAV